LPRLKLKKTKIAIIHYSAPPVIGGAETVLAEQAREFADHGYPVKLIVGRGKQFDERIELNIIKELDPYSPTSRIITRGLDRGRIPGQLHEDIRTIEKKLATLIKGVDVVIIHNALTVHFNLALSCVLRDLVLHFKKIRFYAWCHDHTFLDPEFQGKALEYWPWNIIAHPVPNVRYITVSDDMRTQLANFYGIKESEIKVIPNGVSIERFLNLSDKSRKLFFDEKLQEADLVFLYPARVMPRKNIELAIDIMREIKKTRKKIKLIITGPPDSKNKVDLAYFRSVKARAKKLGLQNEIIFLYDRLYVDDKMINDLYRLSDMLLFTTHREGFGIPILEAGLARIPAAVAKIKPLTELADSDEILYIDTNDRPAKLAKQIIKFGEVGRSFKRYKRVVRNYTWPMIFKKHIEPLVKK